MTAGELQTIFGKKLIAAYRAALLNQDDRAWQKVAEYLSGILIIQNAFGRREHRDHSIAFAEHELTWGPAGPETPPAGPVRWDAALPGPHETDDWKRLQIPERRAMERLLTWVSTTRNRWTAMLDSQRRRAFFITGVHRRGVLDAARKQVADSLTKGEPIIDVARALKDMVDSGQQHLETVVRTNMARARSEGEVAKWKEPHLLTAFPGARYRSTKSRTSRETHKAMDGFCILVTDPDFARLVPPNGYNCECWLERLSRRQCENLAMLEKNSDRVLTSKVWPTTIARGNWERGLFPDEGFDHAKVD